MRFVLIALVVALAVSSAQAQHLTYEKFVALKTGSSYKQVQSVFPADTLKLVQTFARLKLGLSDFNVYVISISDSSAFPAAPLYAVFTFDTNQDLLVAKALAHTLTYTFSFEP